MGKKPTPKQQRAIDELVGSGGKITPTEAMRRAEYAKATYNTPQKLTESRAYLENFNVPRAKETVGHILVNGQESNKLKAAQEIFKVEGAYAPEKNESVNVNVEVKQNRETIRKIAQEVIKKMLDGNTKGSE